MAAEHVAGTNHDPLILVPTEMERDRLRTAMRRSSLGYDAAIESCGFGIAAAAAMTMWHLQQRSVHHVILAGIAGSLSEKCSVGSAYWFSQVICDGIGVGEGDSFESAAAMGWKQLDVEDAIELLPPTEPTCLALVTGCAASTDRAMATRRALRASKVCSHGGAENPCVVAAEDMEGFGVAMACRIMNVRLSIVRGISNVAGDRQHSNWRIDDAIDAVADQLLSSRFAKT